MKNFKLVFIISALVAGNTGCATNAANKDCNPNTAAATKETTAAVSKTDDTNNSETNKNQEIESDKVGQSASSRAIGSLLSNKSKKSNSKEAGTDPQKKIQELEELIKEQQKLIEMYKKSK